MNIDLGDGGSFTSVGSNFKRDIEIRGKNIQSVQLAWSKFENSNNDLPMILNESSKDSCNELRASITESQFKNSSSIISSTNPVSLYSYGASFSQGAIFENVSPSGQILSAFIKKANIQNIDTVFKINCDYDIDFEDSSLVNINKVLVERSDNE